MIAAPIPANEQERLQELIRYEVLYTQYEEDFDQIVQLASAICKTPISTITLLDFNKQWFKAKTGVDNAEGDRDTSFCGHAIVEDEAIMIVNDALEDQRFVDNPLVIGEPKIRFYAGYPLVSPSGYKLGTLCVIDRVPRSLTAEQELTLKILGNQVVKLFELRLRNKEAEARNELIEEQKKQLEESKSVQSKIISIIAHDVRGPVTSLKTMIELTKSKSLTEAETVQLFDMLDKQLDGTLDMLTNLVDWGSMLLKKGKLSISTVNISLVVEKIIKNLSPMLQLKKNQFQNLVPKDVEVIADENTLRFILRNIISNANKFTSEGNITVDTQLTESKDFISIIVADTGCGIPIEIQQQLFNPAKRHSREGTNKEKGSGLGLLLAKEFAEAMHASIDVKSDTGKGTSFSITLPVSI
ncbi:MAG: HAMP domain-containing sensor histidine kinase [Sediminibacterium sp.]|jgi:signal transduction histidine kinase|uniref:GAF domain-containing sensor histidine kinase n=2 Tax=Bacteria TaxID=2 RepID=UPI002ABBABED|nr:HAMP domain-containing sensor histidine kinase [Sediminibacterium sp.]MDZ4071468.1 HAMP domain-containing sensor histidine kinase [Sediminibacterium sp.]